MNARIRSKQTLCFLAFVTFGAMSSSVPAQSMEYRRGYDQGYRDGVAAAQSGQAQPGGRAGRILIEEARYGTRDDVCDAREAVQRIAAWRRYITIRADNALCGDPAPGRPKRLVVRYRCGDGLEQRAVAREGGIVSLSCR